MPVSPLQNNTTRFGIKVTAPPLTANNKDSLKFTVQLEPGEPEALRMDIPVGQNIYVRAHGLTNRDPYQRRLDIRSDGLTSDQGRSQNLVYNYVDSNFALESLHRLVDKLPDASFAEFKRPLSQTIDAIGSIFIARGGY